MKLTLRNLVFCSTLLTLLSVTESFGQARIVFGATSDAYIVMNNTAVNQAPTSIYLVIGDGTTGTGLLPNTITRTTNGAIITNSENNVIKWGIGDCNGSAQTYVVPFAYGTIASYAGNYIPFTYSITTVGAADHFVSFSTYRTPTSDNQANPPTGVTNDWSSACACNASPWMVDRFWMLDNDDYGNAGNTPNGALIFQYVDGAGVGDAENETGSLTAAMEIDLQAEAFNSNAGKWVGTLFAQDVPASNYVVTGNIGSANLYQKKYWTLVEKNHPLPVTFLDVSADCNRGDVTIKWSTATEQNSDYFTVERSTDGVNFTSLGNVLAAGQSSTIKKYYYVDADPLPGVSFYRVRETDFNGSTQTTDNVIVNGCTDDEIFIYGNEGSVTINIEATEDVTYNFDVYDVLGQQLKHQTENITAGSHHFKLDVNNMSSAMYVVKVYSATHAVSKKVFVRAPYIH